MRVGGFLAGMVIGAVLAVLVRATEKDCPALPFPLAPQASADVSDLFARLRPVIDDNYSLVNSVRFTTEGVTLSLKLKNGNTQEVSASDLRSAVRQLTTPDGSLADALRGWESVR